MKSEDIYNKINKCIKLEQKCNKLIDKIRY